MHQTFDLVDVQALPPEKMDRLDLHVDRILASVKDDRTALNRLVYQNVTLLTELEAKEGKLAKKNFFMRFLGNFTGSNRKQQSDINRSRTESMYVAQEVMRKVEFQGLMAFDLAVSLHNRLNLSLNAIEERFYETYDAIRSVLDDSIHEMTQMQARTQRAEANLALLNWRRAIEYQTFEGREYAELDATEKLACVTRDFFDLTDGQWTTSDLFLLKSSIGMLGVDPDAEVDILDTLRELTENVSLLEKFSAGGAWLLGQDAILPLCGAIQKYHRLHTTERYLIDTILQFHQDATRERKDIEGAIVNDYMQEHYRMDLRKHVKIYELALDFLFHLSQVIPSEQIAQ